MAFASGGTPHTSQVSVTTTASIVAVDRSASSGAAPRSALVIQQAGSVDVTLGGSDVVAGQGIVLRGNPDSTTQPAEFNCGSTDKAIWGRTASGTATLNVYEEY